LTTPKTNATSELEATLPTSVRFLISSVSVFLLSDQKSYYLCPLSVCLSVHLSFLFVFLTFSLFLSLSICLSVSICLCLCLSVTLFLCPSILLSIFLSFALPICLSFSLSVCLSVSLSPAFLCLCDSVIKIFCISLLLSVSGSFNSVYLSLCFKFCLFLYFKFCCSLSLFPFPFLSVPVFLVSVCRKWAILLFLFFVFFVFSEEFYFS
jgi:hypothetical protein